MNRRERVFMTSAGVAGDRAAVLRSDAGKHHRPRCPRVIVVLFGTLALTACGTAETPRSEAAPAEEASPVEDAAERPARPNQLSVTEAEEGWRLLFDGVSFAGWRGLGRSEVPAGHWTIEEGAIRKVAGGNVPTAPDGQPLEGGDLMTIDTFTDFELTFEWKVAPGANSGIKYNVSEQMSTSAEPVHAALGFEYQVLDDDLHPDAQNGPNRTAAALYDLMGPAPVKQLKPVGEFNQARLVFRGAHGEHWLNGAKVLEFDLDTDEFATRLAASKYAPIEGFADKRAGHIVLQDHGDEVWFRNIKVLELELPASH